jgi:hypothetical protein
VDHYDTRVDTTNYNRMTTIAKIKIRRIKPAVIKKLNLRSGNRSVSIIPFVSIIGITAWNNSADVASSIPKMMNFISPDENEPDDTLNGPMKNKMIKNNDTPNSIHEYFVFSLY